MRPNPFSRALLCYAAVFSGGCGGLADGGYRGPPLAVVRGTFVEDVPLAGATQLSLALIWSSAAENAALLDVTIPSTIDARYHEECATVLAEAAPACDGTPAAGERECDFRDDRIPELIQSVEFEAHLGGSFEIRLHDPPPSSALYDLSSQGGTGTFALARVVAFVDDDGDGVLRDGTPAAPPEAVVAVPFDVPGSQSWHRSYGLVFLDGIIEPERFDPALAPVLLFAPQGFSVWLTERILDAYDRPVATVESSKQIETPIELVTSEDVHVACREGKARRAFVQTLPGDAEPLWCSSDHYQAKWARRTAVSACDFREERFEADFTCASVPPPPWNCPGG